MRSELVTVTLPRDVLIRALWKARRLYEDVAYDEGLAPGPSDECWAEFEALSSYVGTLEELQAQETVYLIKVGVLKP